MSASPMLAEQAYDAFIEQTPASLLCRESHRRATWTVDKAALALLDQIVLH